LCVCVCVFVWLVCAYLSVLCLCLCLPLVVVRSVCVRTRAYACVRCGLACSCVDAATPPLLTTPNVGRAHSFCGCGSGFVVYGISSGYVVKLFCIYIVSPCQGSFPLSRHVCRVSVTQLQKHITSVFGMRTAHCLLFGAVLTACAGFNACDPNNKHSTECECAGARCYWALWFSPSTNTVGCSTLDCHVA